MPATLFFDLSDWSVLTVTGPDRASFLHSFCTNDIKRLKSGEGCEAFITTIKGRILSHVLVFAEPEKLTLIAVPGSNNALTSHLTKYLIGVEAEVQDETGQHAVVCVAGPEASSRLGKLTAQPATFGGCVTPDDNWVKAAGELGLGSQQPPFEQFRPGDHVRSSDWLMGRVDMFNSPGFLCVGPASGKETFTARLLQAGVTLGSMEQFHALRIEAGFPWHGIDISEDHIAQEAGRTDRTVSFTKGCYLGQEPIARLDAMGHTNRELRGLLISGRDVPEPGSVIQRDGADVGKITSAAISVDRQSVVGLGILRVAAGAPGTAVQVRFGTQEMPATVFWPRLT